MKKYGEMTPEDFSNMFFPEKLNEDFPDLEIHIPLESPRRIIVNSENWEFQWTEEEIRAWVCICWENK